MPGIQSPAPAVHECTHHRKGFSSLNLPHLTFLIETIYEYVPGSSCVPQRLIWLPAPQKPSIQIAAVVRWSKITCTCPFLESSPPHLQQRGRGLLAARPNARRRRLRRQRHQDAVHRQMREHVRLPAARVVAAARCIPAAWSSHKTRSKSLQLYTGRGRQHVRLPRGRTVAAASSVAAAWSGRLSATAVDAHSGFWPCCQTTVH